MALYIWLRTGNRNVTSTADNHVLVSPAVSPSCSAAIRDHAVLHFWKHRGLSSNWGSHNQAALCPEKTKDTSSRSSMWVKPCCLGYWRAGAKITGAEQLWGTHLHGDGKGAKSCSALCAHKISHCSLHVLCEYPIEAPWLISPVKCCSAGMRTANCSPMLHIFTCTNSFHFSVA